MRPFTFIASLFALVSAVAATSGACEPGERLIAMLDGTCGCLASYRIKPPKAGCKTVIQKYSNYKTCSATCPPQPSHKPESKRTQPILMPDETLSRCPSPMVACPLPGLNGERATTTISTSDPYECIEPAEDLYNCGGCSSTSQGTNCNVIAGVRGTSCIQGKCMIYTCQKGYKLIVNDQGAQECVRKTPRHV